MGGDAPFPQLGPVVPPTNGGPERLHGRGRILAVDIPAAYSRGNWCRVQLISEWDAVRCEARGPACLTPTVHIVNPRWTSSRISLVGDMFSLEMQLLLPPYLTSFLSLHPLISGRRWWLSGAKNAGLDTPLRSQLIGGGLGAGLAEAG